MVYNFTISARVNTSRVITRISIAGNSLGNARVGASLMALTLFPHFVPGSIRIRHISK